MGYVSRHLSLMCALGSPCLPGLLCHVPVTWNNAIPKGVLKERTEWICCLASVSPCVIIQHAHQPALVPQQEAATGSLTNPSCDEEPEEPALDTREGQGGTEVQIQASQRQGPKSLAPHSHVSDSGPEAPTVLSSVSLCPNTSWQFPQSHPPTVILTCCTWTSKLSASPPH